MQEPKGDSETSRKELNKKQLGLNTRSQQNPGYPAVPHHNKQENSQHLGKQPTSRKTTGVLKQQTGSTATGRNTKGLYILAYWESGGVRVCGVCLRCVSAVRLKCVCTLWRQLGASFAAAEVPAVPQRWAPQATSRCLLPKAMRRPDTQASKGARAGTCQLSRLDWPSQASKGARAGTCQLSRLDRPFQAHRGARVSERVGRVGERTGGTRG